MREKEEYARRERTRARVSLRNAASAASAFRSLHFSASFSRGVKRAGKKREWMRSNDYTEADFVIETFLYFHPYSSTRPLHFYDHCCTRRVINTRVAWIIGGLSPVSGIMPWSITRNEIPVHTLLPPLVNNMIITDRKNRVRARARVYVHVYAIGRVTVLMGPF